jgi:DNA-binding beta-propeller fold protein YncE
MRRRSPPVDRLERMNTPTRRQILAAGAALVTTACRRTRPTGYPGYALISAAGENSITSIDLNTFQLVRKLSLKAAPSSIAVGADRAFVLTPSNGVVHMVDPERLTQSGAIRLSDQADLIRLSPDGKQIVAISSSARELIVADVAARKVVKRVRLQDAPIDFDLRPSLDGKRLYAAISSGTGQSVEMIDLKRGDHLHRQLGAELGGLRLRSDGELIFCANYKDQTMLILDPATLGTVCELQLPMRPENLVFGAGGGQLFVTGSGMDGVAIIFAFRTLEVEQTVLAGRAPGAMACSENPAFLFVASRAGSEISILNVDTRKVVALTQAGEMPRHIVITPDQQYALILDETSGDMAVIRIPSITSNRLKTGASLFAMVPVGEKPVDAAIFTRGV